MADRPYLREIGGLAGILPGYHGTDGDWHETSAATYEALLAALGVDASSEASAHRAIGEAYGRVLDDDTDPAGRGCFAVEDAVGDRRVFGVAANLYSMRSDSGCGVGDVASLNELIDFAAASGASFAGINPLCAIDERRGDGNPYFPISRLFGSWVYIDVEAVPELATCREAGAVLRSERWRRRAGAGRDAAQIDWPEVLALKRAALEPLYRCLRPGSSRREQFERFRRKRGACLTDFATYCAIAEREAGAESDWRRWPVELRDSQSASVRVFREQNLERVELYEFLQFELDRQLGAAAQRARESGVELGIYGDLPVGVAPGGSDVWAQREQFVDGVTIGAPPDAYAEQGQDWGIVPLDPRALDRPGNHWQQMLDRNMEHCGVLRIDHAMGVVRQYWIPAGRPATEGAYVRYPTSPMLRALADASRRKQCVVVAEDLGTVPQGFREQLERWRILRHHVLYFERDGEAFVGPDRYAAPALVAANTHDLAPLEGYWAGTDLELRMAGGTLDGSRIDDLRAERARDTAALRDALRREGVVAEGWQPREPLDLGASVYAFLARAPSRLLSVALDDLAGEREQINVPAGADPNRPSWCRRMHRSLSDLRNDPGLEPALTRIRLERSRAANE